MNALLLLGLMSTSEASPAKGFRLGVCTGFIDSACNFGGIRLTGVLEYVGVSLGASLLNANGVAQVYVIPSKNNVRPFAYAGLAIGAPIVLNGGVGLDWHLGKSRQFILTPRVGYGVIGIDEQLDLFPGISLELSYSFSGDSP